jgi:hypothetical protein
MLSEKEVQLLLAEVDANIRLMDVHGYRELADKLKAERYAYVKILEVNKQQ